MRPVDSPIVAAGPGLQIINGFMMSLYLFPFKTIFIAGNYHMFLSGVQTDATIEPGQTFDFEITISYPANTKVSYFIPKITWQEFD